MASHPPKVPETITVHLTDRDYAAFKELAMHNGDKPAVHARDVIRKYLREERDRARALAAIFSDDE
jgi:hypothetical protein